MITSDIKVMIHGLWRENKRFAMCFALAYWVFGILCYINIIWCNDVASCEQFFVRFRGFQDVQSLFDRLMWFLYFIMVGFELIVVHGNGIIQHYSNLNNMIDFALFALFLFMNLYAGGKEGDNFSD